ncbi:ABC transporter [Nocardiopsis sp. NPDC007018]|uniref:ABC transporter n=1 Tax=Nocardiopsis sp. NPDC007018 TaxID=3155721 RepID=UPI00340C2486
MSAPPETLPPRLRDAVRAETTKILPVTWLALSGTLAANTLFAVLATVDGLRFGIGDDVAPLSAFAVVMFAPVHVFLLLPLHAVGSEFREGQLRTTLAAVPWRGRLALAKFLATGAVVVPAAVAVLLPGRTVLALAQDAGAGAVLADTGRWVLAYAMVSAVALGLAALMRGTAAPLTVLVGVSVFAGGGFLQWPEGVRLLPDQAAMSLLGTPAFEVTELAPGVAAVVLVVWAAVSCAVYAGCVVRRDA